MELYINSFIEWMNLKMLSETTKHHYLYYLDKIKDKESFNQEVVNKLLGDYPNSITRALVRNYITFIREYKDITKVSDEDCERIKSIYLTKVTGRKKERIIETITSEELKAIYKVMTNERDRMMLLVSWFGALRLGGLLSLTPRDISFDDFKKNINNPLRIKIIEKGNIQREVFLPAKLGVSLLAWYDANIYKTEEDLLKPIFRVTKQNWQQILARASVKAIGNKIYPHCLRRSFATNLFNNQDWNVLEIKDFLGHKNLSSTERYIKGNKQKLYEKYKSIT